MIRALKLLLIFCSVAVIFAVVGFLIWALWIPAPQPQALDALSSDDSVRVDPQPWLIFRPTGGSLRTGLIIYPGARVDARAYAPLARTLATKGITVAIPSMPLNLAIFGPNKASEIITATPEIDRWFIGGHSLGGTMAADFASRNRAKVSGIILLASYPLAGSGLAAADIPVLSVYGTNDQIATVSEINESRMDLPSTTRWIEIIGGNHSQFGWYGEQPGDGQAAISREEQQRQVTQAIMDFLGRSASRQFFTDRPYNDGTRKAVAGKTASHHYDSFSLGDNSRPKQRILSDL